METEQKERQVKGIWIPIEIWKDKNLTWNEKILFLEIDSFTSKDKDCFFSNEQISELLGISETNANKTLSSLINKGYVVKTKFDGRRRYVKSALSYSTSLPCQERQASHACANVNNNNNDNNDNILPNKITKKEKELKEKFASFVAAYKKMGGKVRGVDTEFNDFVKRHKDWKEVLPYLELAVQRETKQRQQAQAERKFFPEPKMLQTYLGKQRAWELYVTVGEDLAKEEYTPMCGGALNWNDYYNCYMYVGFWNGKSIADGYSDDRRPDGASITLNNGRGTIVWNREKNEWVKK